MTGNQQRGAQWSFLSGWGTHRPEVHSPSSLQKLPSARSGGRHCIVTSFSQNPEAQGMDTVKNAKTSPSAKKSVMIYDTQSGEVVGNNVYDVQSPPSVGSTAKFESYSAEYVGGGG